MSVAVASLSGAQPTGPKVLIVDDSAVQRRLLAIHLRKMGYDVLEAENGEAALDQFSEHRPGIVLSDWMMPGMSGIDLCRAIKSQKDVAYTYFVLLTSKSETDDVAHGLDVGADDFLTKPVEKEELRARLAAGERILRMEQALVEKSNTIAAALDEIQTLYAALDRDLRAAEELQRSLLPAPDADFGSLDISVLLKSSGHLGGDLVSYFPINDRCLGFYALDVAGHGIASALMTARVASLLHRAAPGQNLAVCRGPDGQDRPVSPELVATRLNEVVQQDMETDLYFTMIIGHIDTCTGMGRMTQAGHPHPCVIRKGGGIETIGGGGAPIGLISSMTYDSFDFDLREGERLVIISDGITECEDAMGIQLEDVGLSDVLTSLADTKQDQFLGDLLEAVQAHRGTTVFDDDVSAILLSHRARR